MAVTGHDEGQLHAAPLAGDPELRRLAEAVEQLERWARAAFVVLIVLVAVLVIALIVGATEANHVQQVLGVGN